MILETKKCKQLCIKHVEDVQGIPAASGESTTRAAEILAYYCLVFTETMCFEMTLTILSFLAALCYPDTSVSVIMRCLSCNKPAPV